MELDEFISKTLVQIIAGVTKAQDEHSDLVNPMGAGKVYRVNRPPSEAVKSVDFDVAVTVEEKKGAKGGAKISVLGNNIGGSGGSESTERSVTKIKFSVPICYGLTKN